MQSTLAIWTLLGTALALAMDAFAVAAAIAASLRGCTPRQSFRLCWHFGLFQTLMPIIGWFGGRLVAEALSSFDHWLALAILSFLGGKMIFEAARGDHESRPALDPTRGLSLIMLSVATSIDALAVGLTLGLMGVRIWFPSLIIGLVAALMTFLGTILGRRVGERLGRFAEYLGGIVLIFIGGRILVQHLWGW